MIALDKQSPQDNHGSAGKAKIMMSPNSYPFSKYRYFL